MGRSIILQIAMGVSLIILAGGTLSYIHSHRFHFGGVVALVLVVCLIGMIFKHMYQLPKVDQPSPQSDEVIHRISTLESRLTDIQDIVIAIDDRLTRQARQEIQDVQS
jgi:predicted metal-dependent enzyme (double-stranded beta helix superfamily)